MNLDHHVEEVRRQLAIAADAGGEEARALAERLGATLESVVRLSLLEALSAAAAEITREIAPGSVEVRLHGREPEFVVTAPPADVPVEQPPTRVPAEDAAMSRINLRLPDHLKSRIEEAAEREGLSINAWLVRAAAAGVDRRDAQPPARSRLGGQRYRGWAR
jgi:hypothetical protein